MSSSNIKQSLYPPASWLTIVFGLTMLALPMIEKQVLRPDEVMTYLSTTGHESEFKTALMEHDFPFGTWVPAAEWHRFLQPEANRGFLHIARDLFYWDIHPPLYYWLLNLWTRLWGTNLWAGSLLNWLLVLTSLLVLYRLGLSAFGLRQVATFICAVWILSPVLRPAVVITRPYLLLTFLAVLFVSLIFRWDSLREATTRTKLLWGISVVVVGAAGLLTQYEFAVFLVLGALFIGMKTLQTRLSRVIAISVSALAFSLTLALLPDSFGPIVFFQTLSLDIWPLKLEGLTQLWDLSLSLLAPLGVSIACAGIAAALSMNERWTGPTRQDRMPSTGPALWFLLFFLLPSLALACLYLVGIMGRFIPRYLTFVTPFVALVAGYIVMKADRRIVPLAVLLILGLLTVQASWPTIRFIASRDRLDTAILRTADLVVIDDVLVPQFVMNFDRDQKLFIDSQASLIAEPRSWLPWLNRSGGLYVTTLGNSVSSTSPQAEREEVLDLIDNRNPPRSTVRFRRPFVSSTEGGRDEILGLLDEHNEVRLIARFTRPYVIVEVYRVTPPH